MPALKYIGHILFALVAAPIIVVVITAILFNSVFIVPVLIMNFYSMFEKQISQRNCHYHTVDAALSKDGHKLLARIKEICNNNASNGSLLLAVVKPGEEVQKKDIFFSITACNKPTNPTAISATWLDNNNILIATPKESMCPTDKKEIRGIHIHYRYYPERTNTFRSEASNRIANKLGTRSTVALQQCATDTDIFLPAPQRQ